MGRIEVLERELAQERARREAAEEQLSYYQDIARQIGRRRLRELHRLNTLVDQLKKTEEMLETERNQLLSIFDAIDERIYIADPESYEVLYANQALVRDLGPVAGAKCYRAFHGREEPCPFCTNPRIFKEPLGQPCTWEFQNLRNQRWYHCIDRAISWPDGRWVRCELAIDITQSRRQEEEQALRQKMESVSRLAGGIAHDFNDTLNAILAKLSVIRQGRGEEMEQVLGEIEGACQRAKRLNSKLTTVSRGHAPVKEPVSVGELLHETAETALRGSALLPELALPKELWTVEADRSQISQAVRNIVINAEQASPAGGVLRIWAENCPAGSQAQEGLPPGPYVRISVQDHGEGIPEENQDRVFDAYFSTKPDGHGLGLATAYSIVRRHGGQLRFWSQPGRGTTFQLSLPATSDLPQAPPRPAAPQLDGDGRVLVMDDQELIQHATRRLLGSLGYDCQVASDGEQALRMQHQALGRGAPFDVVIVDLNAPGRMGGARALPVLRSVDPAVRVIVSSGYLEHPVVRDHGQAGFDAVLRKPYGAAELRAALREAGC